MKLPVMPPISPMLAKLAREMPAAGEFLFEPKWDGFRSIVFRDGAEVEWGSRNEKPLTRYFPELVEAARRELPERCVIDGEIVIITPAGLDFDALQQRIHPAASRVAKLSAELPAAFVAFDLLALDDDDLRDCPFSERRSLLEKAMAPVGKPFMLTPATTEREVAEVWFDEFEGAGLDGVVAKPLSLPYRGGERAMVKIKHQRTADCVVAGFRWHKSGGVVGSLLLGLYDDQGGLHHVGVTSSFTMARRRELVSELEPYRKDALATHPWRDWAEAPVDTAGVTRMPGGQSRWSAGKDSSWEPLRPELVCEVAYDHMQGDRFRHATTFQRWRSDRSPESCTYEQLDSPVVFDLPALLEKA